MLQNRSHSIILLMYIAEEFLCSFLHAYNMSYQIVNLWYQCTVLSSGGPCEVMYYCICVCLYYRILHVFHHINYAKLFAMSLQGSLDICTVLQELHQLHHLNGYVQACNIRLGMRGSNINSSLDYYYTSDKHFGERAAHHRWMHFCNIILHASYQLATQCLDTCGHVQDL